MFSSLLTKQGPAMLVLSRKKDERIIIGDQITVMVIGIRGDKVRLGIDAPKEVTVHREEVYEAIRREQQANMSSADVRET
jgi:carbon storage regulator